MRLPRGHPSHEVNKAKGVRSDQPATLTAIESAKAFLDTS
jgi:hypothetical protein